MGAELDALVAYLDRADVPHRITATTGGNHVLGSRHWHPCLRPTATCKPRGLAIDVAGTVSYYADRARARREMRAIFDAFVPVGGQLFELIYSEAPYNVKAGRRVARYALAAHYDHVHVAVNPGVIVRPPNPPAPPPPHPQEGHPMVTTANRPAVKLLADPHGRGYWEAYDDGGIATFPFEGRDLPFLGSMGGVRLSAPIVDAALRPQGDGYWLLSADGGVFAFGAAPYLGGHAAEEENAPFTSITSSPTGAGYWLLGTDGGVFTYGDAVFAGTMLYAPAG
jgi:hypothetical protein